jgi:hypothetical protein
MSEHTAATQDPDTNRADPELDEVEVTAQGTLDAQPEVDEADALEAAQEVPIDEDEYR